MNKIFFAISKLIAGVNLTLLLASSAFAVEGDYDSLSISVIQKNFSGKYIEAQADAKQLVTDHPNDYFSQLQLYRASFNLQDYQTAINSADQLIRLEPDIFNPYYLKASAQYASGQYAEAQKTLNSIKWKSRLDEEKKEDLRIFQDKIESTWHPDATKTYNDVKINSAEPSRNDESLALMDKIIKESPDYYLYYWMRGFLHYYTKSPRKAISDFKKAIELNPFWAVAYYWLACQYTDREDYEEALETITVAQILDKYDKRYEDLEYKLQIKYSFSDEIKNIENKAASAWFERFGYISYSGYTTNLEDGKRKVIAGNLEAAYAALTRSLAIEPLGLDALKARYAVATKLQKYNIARFDASKIIIDEPDKIDSYIKMAQAEFLLKNYAAARTTLRSEKWDKYGLTLEQIVEKDTLLGEIENIEHPVASAIYQKVNEYTDKNDFATAEKLLDDAIKANPDYYLYWARRGGVKIARGNTSGAMPDLIKAESLNSQNTLIWALMGYGFYQNGNINDAYVYLSKLNQVTQQYEFANNCYREISAIKGHEYAQQKEAESQRQAQRDAKEQAENRKIEEENARIRKANAELESSNTGGYWQMNADASKRDLENMQKADALRRNADYRRQNNCSAGDTRAECR
jgi:tetratricopeptide (TPR) repeat protein